MCFSVVCKECNHHLGNHDCIAECFDDKSIMYIICNKCYPIAKFIEIIYPNGFSNGDFNLGFIKHDGQVVITSKLVHKPYQLYILTDAYHDYKYQLILVSAKSVFEHLKRNNFDIDWFLTSSQT